MKADYLKDLMDVMDDMSKDIRNEVKDSCETCQFTIRNEIVVEILTHEIFRHICLYTKEKRLEIWGNIHKSIPKIDSFYQSQLKEVLEAQKDEDNN
jgi:hypothetical protein